MKKSVLAAAALATLAAGAMTGTAGASTFSFDFDGPGVYGSLAITYGPGVDAKYPGAYEVTGISGSFSDTNIGMVDAAVGPLLPINYATPEPSNKLAPHDFSRFAVASGLPDESHGFVTFDNLYYPGGSPQTATDYPVSGGFLDIYGLMFEIGGGTVVDLWSNGNGENGVADYGVAVATASTALDYVGGGVSVPEPGSLALLGGGLLGLVGWRRRETAGR